MASLAELEEKQRRLEAELFNVANLYNASVDNGTPNEGLRERYDNLQRGVSGCKADRHAALLEASERPGAQLPSEGAYTAPGQPAPRQSLEPLVAGHESRQEMRDRALELLDHFQGALSPAAGDRLDAVIRSDKTGGEQAYLRAVASPVYERAFSKYLALGDRAAFELTDEERRSVQLVRQAQEFRGMTGGGGFSAAGMSVGVGSEGGFAVPFQLDSSIMLSSDGAISPLPTISGLSCSRERTSGAASRPMA